MEEPEQECPATSLTPAAVIWFATATACFGSQASSPVERSSFLPSTPPAALMSATAISPPFFICAPKEAYWPVIGPTMAIGVVLSPSPPPQPVMVTAAAKAMSSPAIRCIVTSQLAPAHILRHPEKAQAQDWGQARSRQVKGLVRS